MPFLPLYLLDLGAGSNAKAVFWLALAAMGQGIARLVAGPVWGILSDRFGRKLMLLRALYLSSCATLFAGVLSEPWQIVLVLVMFGLFAGFIPAAVALTSVTVPDSQLNASLRWVTGAQYLGSTLGPAIGAGLAILFGYRGAILFAAVLPALAATAVLVLVPRDEVTPRAAGEPESAPRERFWHLLSFQFGVVLFLYFLLFALPQLLRLLTPLALQGGNEDADVAGSVGIAFTVGGLASLFGVTWFAGRYLRAGRMRTSLTGVWVVLGIGHAMLAVSGVVPFFIFWFAVISLLQAAMLPATNTLIAACAPRGRRGTAFGIAGSAQALAFMAGPAAAAVFAAVSLDLGFVVLGFLSVGVAVLIFLALREPALEDAAAVESRPLPTQCGDPATMPSDCQPHPPATAFPLSIGYRWRGARG